MAMINEYTSITAALAGSIGGYISIVLFLKLAAVAAF
jgi:hypothetical protein